MNKLSGKDFFKAILLGVSIVIIAPPLTGFLAGFVPLEFLKQSVMNVSVISAVVGGVVVMLTSMGLDKLKYFK